MTVDSQPLDPQEMKDVAPKILDFLMHSREVFATACEAYEKARPEDAQAYLSHLAAGKAGCSISVEIGPTNLIEVSFVIDGERHVFLRTAAKQVPMKLN